MSAAKTLVQLLVILFTALAGVTEIVYTNHALDSRNRTVNAEFLVAELESFFNNGGNCPQDGKCDQWQFWICLDHNGKFSPHGKFLCQLKNNPKKWGGVVIGLKDKNPVVVTGYMGNWKYWQKMLFADKCFEVSVTAKLMKKIIEAITLIK